ncbi:MAG: VOC family protein [Chloroflexia bacterium]|nr:VOC family protein [Chloroflexia bacterium]
MLSILLTTFDCEDAAALSRFWVKTLGYTITFERADWVMIGNPERKDVGLGFQPVPEKKTVKNRVHLDILVRDEPLETARARLEGFGATTDRFVDNGEAGQHYTMRDIEGNKFWLVPGAES